MEIDGRGQGMSGLTASITGRIIRIDDPSCPAFWAEVRLSDTDILSLFGVMQREKAFPGPEDDQCETCGHVVADDGSCVNFACEG